MMITGKDVNVIRIFTEGRYTAMEAPNRLAEIARKAKGGFKHRELVQLLAPYMSHATIQRILDGRTDVGADKWMIYLSKLAVSESEVDEVKTILEMVGKDLDSRALADGFIRALNWSPQGKADLMRAFLEIQQKEQPDDESVAA